MKKLLSLLLGLMMVFALAACGAPAEAPNTEDEPGVTEPENQPDAESDLAYVKENGKMLIGYTVYEPMNYTDENNEFTGFDTELATLVCEKIGVTPEFVEINWKTKEMELESKSIDCIWNGMTITPDGQEVMEITEPYLQNAQVVIMKAGADYTDTSSLIGKIVAAESNSAGDKVIQNDENLKQAEFVGKTVQTDCLIEVKAGTADAAILDLTLANAMIGEGTSYADLEIMDRLAKEYYGVGFRKGSDICAAVDQAISELKADGTVATLAEKYGLELAD